MPLVGIGCYGNGLLGEQQVDQISRALAADEHGLAAGNAIHENIFNGHFKGFGLHEADDFVRRQLPVERVAAAGALPFGSGWFDDGNIHLAGQCAHGLVNPILVSCRAGVDDRHRP